MKSFLNLRKERKEKGLRLGAGNQRTWKNIAIKMPK
jgi:hypothetical protein